MNTFNKKSLYAALAGVTALGATGAADAVSVNPDGLGQVLIYPYYTVREKVPGAAFNSLLSVVNSTGSTKAVKVRFLEGKASQEVLDFNLYLSPFDVWTVAVLPTADGAGIISKDSSCTQPAIPNATPQPFVNYAYTGDPVGDDSLDRSREGYVELIEMGDVISAAGQAAVKHSASTKVPPNCGYAFTQADIGPSLDRAGLFGGVTLINVLSGEDLSAEATALADFSDQNNWTVSGSIRPNLADVSPPISNVLVGNVVTTSNWFGNPIDAVSAVFMHNSIKNEYVLDTVTLSATDFVMTEPTKRYYYDTDGIVTSLFQRNLGTGGACDDINLVVWDREESPTAPGFSPPPRVGGSALCWEVTVVSFNERVNGKSNVFGSTNSQNISTTNQNGWVNMGITAAASTIYPGRYHEIISDEGTSYVGLPVFGFAAQTFNNGVLASADGKSLVQSSYGGAFSHKYTRSILLP